MIDTDFVITMLWRCCECCKEDAAKYGACVSPEGRHRLPCPCQVPPYKKRERV
jgi:hypothetical protein